MNPWNTDYRVVLATNADPDSTGSVRIDSAGPNRISDGGKLDDIVEAPSSTP